MKNWNWDFIWACIFFMSVILYPATGWWKLADAVLIWAGCYGLLKASKHERS